MNDNKPDPKRSLKCFGTKIHALVTNSILETIHFEESNRGTSKAKETDYKLISDEEEGQDIIKFKKNDRKHLISNGCNQTRIGFSKIQESAISEENDEYGSIFKGLNPKSVGYDEYQNAIRSGEIDQEIIMSEGNCQMPLVLGESVHVRNTSEENDKKLIGLEESDHKQMEFLEDIDTNTKIEEKGKIEISSEEKPPGIINKSEKSDEKSAICEKESHQVIRSGEMNRRIKSDVLDKDSVTEETRQKIKCYLAGQKPVRSKEVRQKTKYNVMDPKPGRPEEPHQKVRSHATSQNPIRSEEPHQKMTSRVMNQDPVRSEETLQKIGSHSNGRKPVVSEDIYQKIIRLHKASQKPMRYEVIGQKRTKARTMNLLNLTESIDMRNVPKQQTGEENNYSRQSGKYSKVIQYSIERKLMPSDKSKQKFDITNRKGQRLLTKQAEENRKLNVSSEAKIGKIADQLVTENQANTSHQTQFERMNTIDGQEIDVYSKWEKSLIKTSGIEDEFGSKIDLKRNLSERVRVEKIISGKRDNRLCASQGTRNFKSFDWTEAKILSEVGMLNKFKIKRLNITKI